MNPYTKEHFPLLRFPFQGAEEVEKNFSQVFQDLFVLAALDGKRSGTFLEIGCYDPVVLSNTLLLEQWGWSGCAVDHSPVYIEKMAAHGRRCFLSLNDATNIDYKSLLDSIGMPSRMDYLSVDVEPNTQTLAALKLALLSGRRFSVITFETEAYGGDAGGNSSGVLRKSRDLLVGAGYVLVAGNISGFEDDAHPFEDWYMDSQCFPAEHIQKFMRDNDAPIAARKYIYNLPGETNG